jgi:hypothetical protein
LAIFLWYVLRGGIVMKRTRVNANLGRGIVMALCITFALVATSFAEEGFGWSFGPHQTSQGTEGFVPPTIVTSSQETAEGVVSDRSAKEDFSNSVVDPYVNNENYVSAKELSQKTLEDGTIVYSDRSTGLIAFIVHPDGSRTHFTYEYNQDNEMICAILRRGDLEIRIDSTRIITTLYDADGEIVGSWVTASPLEGELEKYFTINRINGQTIQLGGFFNEYMDSVVDIRDMLLNDIDDYYDEITDALNDVPDTVVPPLKREQYRLNEPSVADEGKDSPVTDSQHNDVAKSQHHETDSLTIGIKDYVVSLDDGKLSEALSGSYALRPPTGGIRFETDVGRMVLKHVGFGTANAERLAMMRKVDEAVRSIYAAVPEDTEAQEARERFIRLEKHLRQTVIEPTFKVYEEKIAVAVDNLLSKAKRLLGTMQQSDKYVNDGNDYGLVVVPPGEEHDTTTADAE